ncbi:MAG: hypothetical protein PHT58_01660 [Eubacteriales bacterium]|nr:hypothetical protein [Eubacteriales bacterium]
MNVDVVKEYNDNGCMFWVEQLAGAFVRGKTAEEALDKLPAEVRAYTLWANGRAEQVDAVNISYEKKSVLKVEDADSDVLFPSERLPMNMAEYTLQKELAIRSAKDFRALYLSVPQRDRALVKSRQTFYGKIPASAKEMVTHTNNTLAYYAAGIGIEHTNLEDFVDNRLELFKEIEGNRDFLLVRVFTAKDGEEWTLKKLMRRLIWHDRIHAKALYRKAITFWSKERIVNPFGV